MLNKSLKTLGILFNILGIVIEAGLISLLVLAMFSILFFTTDAYFITTLPLIVRIILFVLVLIVWGLSILPFYKEFLKLNKK